MNAHCQSAQILQSKKVKFAFSDSFMIRVPATSGLEAEARAVIHAVQALASALRINRVLTQLRLHGNDVGVQGAQAHEIASNTSQDGQV